MSLEKNIIRLTKRAIKDFSMIGAGEKIIVWVSWGKDSMVLGYILNEIRKQQKDKFEIYGVYIFKEFLINCDIQFEEKRKYYEEVLKIPLEKINLRLPADSKLNDGIWQNCQRCAYARRIALMKTADKIGATKICLGHHMDDIVTTSFMNMTQGRKLKIMPPINKMECWDFTFIRPLSYIREKDIQILCNQKNIPFSPCSCIIWETTMRNKIKKQLWDFESKIPWLVENSFWALVKDFQEKYKDKEYIVK